MSEHAKLSASGAHRWVNCPASIQAEEGCVDTPSVYAQEGIAAHQLAEHCLTKKIKAKQCLNQVFKNFTVDHEMVDAIQFYTDYVNGIPGDKIYEQRVDFSRWVPGGFGTADTIVFLKDTVSIIDLKYGRGVRVEAEENLQILLYALGTFSDFSFLPQVKHFELVIVQPRLGHVSKWVVKKNDLSTRGEIFSKAAKLALSENPPYRPGEAQCRFCKAAAKCKALADHASNTVKGDFRKPKLPAELSNKDIASLLPQFKLVTDWMSAVKVHALRELECGREIPGYKLVPGRSVRQWSDNQVAEGALRKTKLKICEIFNKKLISPTQAEKILGKGHSVIKNHVVKPEGKPTLAVESDARHALKSGAVQDFGEAA